MKFCGVRRWISVQHLSYSLLLWTLNFSARMATLLGHLLCKIRPVPFRTSHVPVFSTLTDQLSKASPPKKQQADRFQGFIPLGKLFCEKHSRAQDDLQISYSLSSGPGGQHVNKTHSKVEIRFHIPSASWIPENVRSHLMEKEKHRITKDAFFVISSDRTRKQIMNQADCLERIRRMIRECEAELYKPPPDPETLELVQKRQVILSISRVLQ
ncbi:peptidyl-tRNA hydrolase ICT1 [Paragonimus westermani]|uniref:Large ribosomal subunit protein mL62 n=1 Tax=Paragonimus westermani TaxID=34504 RepID=A0A5J4NHP2_9TREM|nr:peptidyl-tRNA hydrolase ICT1 [Paragonimus westermani]